MSSKREGGREGQPGDARGPDRRQAVLVGAAPSRVRLRPRDDTRYIGYGRTVLVTGHDGFIEHGTRQGLFDHQTRLLSCYRWLLDGSPPSPAGLSDVGPNTWLGYYTTPAGDERSGEAPGHVELRVTRSVGEGFREEIVVTNHFHRSKTVRLELRVDADFADVAQADRPRTPLGSVARRWETVDDGCELAIDVVTERPYHHEGASGVARMQRGVRLRFRSNPRATLADDRIVFALELAARQSWHLDVDVVPVIGSQPDSPARRARIVRADEDRHTRFLTDAASFETGGGTPLAYVVRDTLAQAVSDLSALRLDDLDASATDWLPAGGHPVFDTLFGRDSLTAAWQAALVSPALMRGALPVMARYQGTHDDDWRDEQPGRLLHQMDPGPLAALEITPFGRYYGTITTPAFFPIVLSELWHWTGDDELARALLPTARDAVAWLDRDGDLDGDGLYEYQSRSTGGLRNLGWKDSGNAVVHEDGSLADPPIATCEEQAFVYLAKIRIAELLWRFDSPTEGLKVFHQARELRERFNARFWMPDVGFYAMGLDRDKRQIRSISSDIGICLSTAVIDELRLEPTVRRLFADDLFSGWGVRTLSSAHPSYDPFSYQRGSVWPVEQAAIALGLARYGLHDEVNRLARAQFEAAALYEFRRLPELFAGHPRDAAHPFPGVYGDANWPQAWSASSVFCLVQAMTGIYPYAPLELLLVDPHLPPWLPELTVRNLRVGKAVATIRFSRHRDGRSEHEVLDVRGKLRVIRQPSPWSLTAGLAERFEDAMQSLAGPS